MTAKWEVVYFSRDQKNNPIRDFLDSLNFPQQSKVLRVFQYIEEYGLRSVIPHLKKLSNTPFWEIRILGKDNIRIIYVVPLVNIVLLLNGFIKKSNKTPKGEINIAIDRLKQWESSLDK